MGTPRDLLSGDGSVRWSAAYTAWGKIHDEYSSTNTTRGPPTSEVRSPFRLLGQYYDEETGLSATRFRMWEAETGRWLSPDPLGIAGGPNVFGFEGPPSDNADPFGLSSCPVQVRGQRAGFLGRVLALLGIRKLKDRYKQSEIGTHAKAPLFYSTPNGGAGRLWVSTKPVAQGDFKAMVRDLSKTRQVVVLTGTHGDPLGFTQREKAFYREDLSAFGSNPKVRVVDINSISKADLKSLVNGSDDVVCAWCYSEKSRRIHNALD